MGLSRRSLFGVGAGVLAASAIRAEAAPTPISVPRSYVIDFELLTPWPNLYFEEEEKTKDGFELEISVSRENYQESEPYRGAVRWWIKRHDDDEEADAVLSGVAEAEIVECEYRGPLSYVRVNFAATQAAE